MGTTMASTNLNVRGVERGEADRIRAAAASRGETLKEYVVGSGELRADLERAVAVLLEAGAPLPPCPFVRAAEARWDLFPPERVDEHVRGCPICSAAAVQKLVGAMPALGWVDLARDVGVKPADLPELTARFARLPDRERQVLRHLYGLADGGPRPRISGQGAAKKMRLSRERIRQIADRAKVALRTP